MKLKYLLFLLLFIVPFNVFAEDKIANTTTNLNIREKATTESEKIKCENGENVVFSGKVIVLEDVDSVSEGDSCPSKKWYKIEGEDITDGKVYKGFGCSSYISFPEENIEIINTDIIKEKITSYGTINNGYIYKEASTKSTLISDKTYERIAILDSVKGTGCEKMYKILYNNLISYACQKDFINVEEATIIDTSKLEYNYDEEIKKFPESYKKYLDELHKLYPKWRFYAVDINLDFNDVVNSEQKSSLIDASAHTESYFETLESAYYDYKTNTWTSLDSGFWYLASLEATKYYVDPRTYLNEKWIFVFEDLKAYDYQFGDAVKKMTYYASIDGTFKKGNDVITYYDTFKEASIFSKVSPLALIARSRNETGKYTSSSVSGTRKFTYNGKTYSGYYNYYNIGAYKTNDNDAISNGLIYAYKAGWNNRYKAIIEGASFIATKYIYNGQQNNYFQKFNVNPETMYEIYSHQYQTNIEAPFTESTNIYWGYKETDELNNPITFKIPVYKNMPDESTKPVEGNPNNWLTGISIDGVKINNHTDTSGNESFDGNLFYSYNNNWDKVADATYKDNVINYKVAYDKESINIKVTKAYSKSKVSNTGEVKLKDKVNTIDIVVTAENKTTKTYRIIVTKDDKPALETYPDIDKVLNSISVKYNKKYMYGLSIGTTYDNFKNTIKKIDDKISITIKNTNNKTATFATGDIITISNGKDEVKYTYILYGDLNGDAEISILDLIHVRNIIIEESNLSEVYLNAADVNHDGVVNILDLILVRNALLGEAIKQ